MTPKDKGTVALGKAVSYFVSSKYEVSLPIGDKQKYDLIVDKDNVLYRVQVKYGGLYKNRSTCRVALRTMGGNQSFHYAKNYLDSDFDILFVFTAKDESYLLPWSSITARNELAIEASKYKQYLLG